MFSPLTSNLSLTAVPNYSQEVQAPYHFLWQCAFLMFLKLISQRKAWSLQKCWVPYKHWGNVYIICAKKIAQIKPRVCRVQAPRTTGKLSTSFDIILYPETCFTTLQEVHLSNAIHEVHLQGLSLSTVEQQINDAHFAVVLCAST